MLILVLIDVQYSLSFEKSLLVKITPPQIPTTRFPPAQSLISPNPYHYFKDPE